MSNSTDISLRPISTFVKFGTIFVLTACQSPTAGETQLENSPDYIVKKNVDEQITSADFAQVCNGIAIDEAKAYIPDSETINYLYVFERQNEREAFSKSLKSLPNGWEVPWNFSQETSLTACVTIVQETLAKTCEFPSDEEKVDPHLLEIYDTIYQVNIYAAQSAGSLDNTTLDVKAGDCPSFYMFAEGELKDKLNADYRQALLELVGPYVQPTGSAS